MTQPANKFTTVKRDAFSRDRTTTVNRGSISWKALVGIVGASAVAALRLLSLTQISGSLRLFAFWLLWLLAGAAALNSVFRLLSGDLRYRKARVPLVLSFMVNGALVALADEQPNPRLGNLLICAATAMLLLAWLAVEPSIKKAIESSGGASGTDRVRRLGVGRSTVGALVEMWRSSWPGRVLGRLLRPPGPREVSPTKRAIANGLVLVIVAQAAVGFIAHVSSAHPLSRAHHGWHVRQPPPPPVRPISTPADSDPSWSEVCGAIAVPGIGAPRAAAEALYQLFLGPGGPGATAGGCTSAPYHPFYGIDGFVAQVGWAADGEPESIAVTSARFGAAIFIAPAAKVILREFAAIGPLGGSVRLTCGLGDGYLVYTVRGTIALIRSSTVEPNGTGLAQAYTILPESVTVAWLAAMRAAGEWLWPRLVSASSGSETFDLIQALRSGVTVQVITYHRATRTARMNESGARVTYRADGARIPVQIVEQFAAMLAR